MGHNRKKPKTHSRSILDTGQLSETLFHADTVHKYRETCIREKNQKNPKLEIQKKQFPSMHGVFGTRIQKKVDHLLHIQTEYVLVYSSNENQDNF